MTTTEKLSRVNRWRIHIGKFATTEVDGFNGAFLVPLEGTYWHVLLFETPEFRQLSVADADYKRVPPTEVVRQLRNLFFDDEVWIAQLFSPTPPGEDIFAVNLWQFLDEAFFFPGVRMGEKIPTHEAKSTAQKEDEAQESELQKSYTKQAIP